MQQVTKHPNKHFSWIDLASTDLAASHAFYTGLFGWDIVEMPTPGGGTYTMFQMDGKNVAGGGALDEGMKAAGVPSNWTSYINVEDLQAVFDASVAAGAEPVMPPMEIPPSGSMAIIKDPSGGVVGLWQANMHIGAQLVNIPGALIWNELMTRDVEAAKNFFTTVFGWTYEVDEVGYGMFLNNGRANGGVMAIGDEMSAEMPAHWSVYFMVEDVHAAVAKAQELGAGILVPVTEMPNMAFSLLAAPTGESFYVIRMDEVDSMP